MQIKKITLLIVCVLSFIVTKAQDKVLSNAAQARGLSEKVAGLFKESKVTVGIKELRQYWPLPPNEIDALEDKSIKYLNMVEDRFGKAEGTIKVKEETIKDVAMRETYLVKYENTAIRLIFTYYQNDKGWILNAFKWDDSFSLEFK
jgi:hypothetical protein